jgi:REase_MTES_1575/Protein of unknown function (DUF4011)
MDRAVGVAAAATKWAAALRAVGDRGSLACLDTGGVTLDVTEADRAALTALLAGRSVRLRSLIRDRAEHAAASRRVRVLRDDMRHLAEQHGLNVGWLAVGMAAWTATSGDQRAAPVLLRPLRIVARTASEDDFELALGTPYTLNPGLVEELHLSFGVTLDVPVGAEPRVLDSAGPTEVYEALRRGAGPVPNFTVAHRLVLGTYTDAARLLASDLAATQLLADSDVLAMLAGDASATEAVGRDSLKLDLTAPDRIHPSQEFLALDADATASATIAAVLAGRQIVVEGAPGTGRTQTIVNLIAALAAEGRRVLVLVENRRVLQDLLSRLAAAGLAGLAVDAADPEAGWTRISAAVSGAAQPLPPDPDLSGLHHRLVECRDRLRAHVEALHAVRQPWGVSAYAAQAALRAMPAEATSRVRFVGDVLAALHGDTLAEVRDAVREWSELGGTTLTGLDTPWYGARVGSPADAERAQRLAADLAQETYPAARAELERLQAAAALAPAAAVAQWRRALGLLRAVAETERLLTAEVWRAPLADLVAATADPSRRRAPDRLGWQDRIAARRFARRLWQADKPVGSELHDALVRASAQLAEWSQLALRDGSPRIVGGLDAAEKSYTDLLDGLAALQLFLPDRDLPRLAPAPLEKTLQALAADPVLRRLPRLGELAARCSALGLRPFLLDLHTRRLAAELAPLAFEYAWLSSVLAQVAASDPALGDLEPAALRDVLADYQQADREHIGSTAFRLRQRTRAATAAAVRMHPAQAAVVRGGPGGVRDAAGLRQLLRDAPDVVLAAMPCWVMSPYAVPGLLPPERLFDVVVVEEANAVSVPVAAAGLARASRTVLVGDRRQLPPVDLAGHQQPSLLQALAPVLPGVALRTYHRRSDERLVAFLAATVYAGSLLSTPSPGGADRLTHVLVPHRSGTPGQEDSVTAEVQKVVGLVIDHAVHRPEESFGVVTLGSRHAERIAAALRVALVGRPELGDVFRGDAPEPFFIKPCSRSAGELRDVVVFSTGFGKTPEGRLPYQFGPLDAEGGERLLTVGLTRARRRLTLVTSFSSTDLDPARLHGGGPRLLRALLRYAEAPELRRISYADPPPPDGLDLDLRARLHAAGLPVVADHGLGRNRIPLALAAPDESDRMVLTVSTDGPRAAAMPTVRDRYRLRPQQLADLAWAEYRMFSTEFFRDPDRQVARIRAAYDAALGHEPPNSHPN